MTEKIYAPDYDRGIFRLFPTLLSQSLNVSLPAKYRKWVIEDPEFAHDCDVVLILIIDALGAKQYKGELLESLWKQSGKKQLSSVYPSSTSNALGSIFLGAPPEENGLVSVRFFVEGIGNFINSLKASVLGKGENSLPQSGVDPTSFLWKAPLIDKVADKVTIVKFLEKQYEGGLSRFFGRAGETILFGNEIDMFSTGVKAVREVATKNLKSVLFLYTPLLDAVGHSYGPESPEWRKGVKFINTEMQRFLDGLNHVSEDTDKKIGLFITADHGMTKIDHLIELGREELQDVRHNQYIKGIMRSARAAFAHLTGKTHKKAKEKIETTFEGKYRPYRIEEIAGKLWPSLRKVNAFKNRIGSLALLPASNTEFRTKKEGGLFSDLGWGRIPFKGSHGGATEEEIEVPLIYTYVG